MASAPSKKFKNSNLNAVLGVPKQSPTNIGPAVRTAAAIKPKAKPKGLVALGKAASLSSNAKKGAVWGQLAAKSRETVKEDDLASPEWAVMDFKDLQKPRQKEDEKCGSNDDGSPVADGDALAEEVAQIEGADEDEEAFQRDGDFGRSVSGGSDGRLQQSDELPASGGAAEKNLTEAFDFEGQRQFSSFATEDSGAAAGAASSFWTPEAVTTGRPAEFGSSNVDYAKDSQNAGAEPYAAAPAERPPYMAPPSTPAPAPPTLAEAPKTTKSPTLQSSNKCWADSFGNSDEEEEEGFLGPAFGSAREEMDSETPVPGHSAPGAASRRSPPQTPPPAAPRASMPSEAMAPLPRYAPSRWAAPQPPSAPPPPAPGGRQAGPAAKAPGGSHRHPPEAHKSATPPYSPQSGPSAPEPHFDEPFAAPGDPKLYEHKGHDAYGSRDEHQRADQARWGDARGVGLHGQAAAPDHSRGWGAVARPGPAQAPMPVGAPPPAADSQWVPPRAMTGGVNQPEGARSCWGPAVAYTPAFAPRGPVNRPMSEDFANSGWKDKKLWEPPKPTKEDGGRQKTRSHLEGVAAHSASNTNQSGGTKPTAAQKDYEDDTIQPAAGQKKQTSSVADSFQERPPNPASDARLEVEKVPRKPKAPKAPKGPLEALDPDSSSEEESDDEDILPPEYAVLDLTVPRTALVINVSHVLKRLSGCCSLNQLNKALKSFKEKTGVTLETFLRANPMNFKLEGRIVYLIDRDGEKWKPPEGAEQEPAKEKGKGKGKGKQSKGNDSNQAQRGGGDTETPSNRGGGKRRGGERGGDRGGDRGRRQEDDGGGDHSGKKGNSKGSGQSAQAYYNNDYYSSSWNDKADYGWSSHGWDSEWSSGWTSGSWQQQTRNGKWG